MKKRGLKIRFLLDTSKPTYPLNLIALVIGATGAARAIYRNSGPDPVYAVLADLASHPMGKEITEIILCAAFAAAMWRILDAAKRAFRARGHGDFKRGLSWCATCIFLMIYFFAGLFLVEGLKYADGTQVKSSFDALYFSAITWTTVGYGDVLPATSSARLYSAVEALLGYVAMALSIVILNRYVEWGGSKVNARNVARRARTGGVAARQPVAGKTAPPEGK